MSYPGNASLSKETKDRISSTFGQTLDLAQEGRQREAVLGCDFILKMDPLFEPARTLQQRLQGTQGPVETADLRFAADLGPDLSTASVGLKSPAPPPRSHGLPGLQPAQPAPLTLEALDAPAMPSLAEPPAPAFRPSPPPAAPAPPAAPPPPALRPPGPLSLDLPAPPPPVSAPRLDSRPAGDTSTRIQQLLNEGQTAFDASEFQKAIDAWSRIFLIDIDHQEAAARIEQARSLKAEAERQVDQGLHEANTHRNAGRIEDARAAYQRVLRVQPGNAVARDQLAQLDGGIAPGAPGPPALGPAPPALSPLGPAAGPGPAAPPPAFAQAPPSLQPIGPPAPPPPAQMAPPMLEPMAAPSLEPVMPAPGGGGQMPSPMAPAEYSSGPADLLPEPGFDSGGGFGGDLSDDVYGGGFDSFSEDEQVEVVQPLDLSKAAGAKPRRSSLMVGLMVLIVAAGAGWFLYDRWGSIFPNSEEVPPQQAAAVDVVQRATRLHLAGNTESALRELRTLEPDHPAYDRAQVLIEQWAGEVATEAEPPPEEPVEPTEMDGRRETLLARARTAYDEREYIAAAKAFKSADDIAPLEASSADLYEDTKRQIRPLMSQYELFRQGEWEMVLPMLWRKHGEDPNNRDVTRILGDAHYNLGVQALRRGLPDRALEYFDEVLGLYPDDAMCQRLAKFSRAYQDTERDLLYEIYVKQLRYRR